MKTYEVHYVEHEVDRTKTIEAIGFNVVDGGLYLYDAPARVKAVFAAGRWNFINEV